MIAPRIPGSVIGDAPVVLRNTKTQRPMTCLCHLWLWDKVFHTFIPKRQSSKLITLVEYIVHRGQELIPDILYI